jgi:DNA-directed RNA polymerase specialized sigma24 family protein
MISRISQETRRNLGLTARGPALRRYAASLTDDVNAAWLLVHRTLAHAHAAPGEATSGGSLRAWLKAAFERGAPSHDGF